LKAAPLEPVQPHHAQVPPWHRVLVVAVALTAYAPILGNLYAGDDKQIFDARGALSRAPLSTLFDDGYFARYGEDTYRPFATLSSMVDHRVGAKPMRVGHVQNMLWHAGTALLVSSLASQVLMPEAALFSGLVFAVHPATTEAVVSVGYREDAIVGFLVIASFLLTLRGGRGRRTLALIGYALALFTKENAIVLPALVVLARLTLDRHGPLDRRGLARELASFAAVTAGYLVVRFSVLPSPQTFADPAGGGYANTLVAVPRIFLHYLRLLVVPWPLIALYAHMFPWGASVLSQLPWLVLAMSFVLGAVWLARTRPPLGFGLLWFVCSLTPMLHFVPMRVSAADRFLYVPLIGGAVAAGALFAMIAERVTRPVARVSMRTGAAAVLIVFVVLTERRIPVWHDNLALWTDTVRNNPRAYIGRFVLAGAFKADGRRELARRTLEQAVADCPKESRFGRERFCAYYAATLGIEQLESHELESARATFEQSLGFSQAYTPALLGLGSIALERRDLAGARRYAQIAALADHSSNAQVRAWLDNIVRELESTEHRDALPVPFPSGIVETDLQR
jgi:hypothetical protein